MSNELFPSLPGLKWSNFRTAGWNNTSKTTVSGRDFTRAHWSSPRWSYKRSYEFLRAGSEAELQNLVGFFNRHRGDYDTWLFDDEDDNTATAQQFGISDGTTTQFQLLRTFGSYIEPVYEPHASGPYVPAVSVAGVLKTAGTDYTIGANGLITFATAPVSGAITWTGRFYWRCRFTKGELEFEQFLKDLWSQKQVEFKTQKP